AADAREAVLLDRALQPFGAAHSRSDLGLGKDHHEAVGLEPREHVGLPTLELEEERRLRQHSVADPPSVASVERPEVVEIEGDRAEREAVAARARQLLGEARMERAEVGKPGHRVAPGLLAQLLQLEARADGGTQRAGSCAHQAELRRAPALAGARLQVERADALAAAKQRHAHAVPEVAGSPEPRA